MFRSRSERTSFLCLAVVLAASLAAAVPAIAQEAASALRRIVSSEISISRGAAVLELEFDGGERASFAIREGRVFLDGEPLEAAPRELDRAWRDLLNDVMEAPTDRLARLLVDWEAPGRAALDGRLEAALRTGPDDPALAAVSAPVAPAAPEQLSDSVERLVDRIVRLQEQVTELEEEASRPVRVSVTTDRRDEGGVFRHFIEGLSGVFKVALAYGVLFALAFATIFFGGRRFIEGVADTARAATTRSLLVGLAATFLVIPAFILGIIALAISIVGIPALLVWVPLFPVAVGLAVLLGFVGAAHAAGEAMAERRLHASDWFQRGNSYYFLITGLGLLLAPFVAMNVVHMAGPWLGFLYGLLVVVGVIVTWAAMSIGFGAVLLSRGGTRPMRRRGGAPEPGIYAESSGA